MVQHESLRSTLCIHYFFWLINLLSCSSSTAFSPIDINRGSRQLSAVGKQTTSVLNSTPTAHGNRRDAGGETPEEQKRKSKDTSTFWFSDPEKLPLSEDDVLPCRHGLDSDGPLPFGSYRTLGDSQFDPKQTCLLSTGLDFWNTKVCDEIDPNLAVTNAQKMIDSGLTTFHINEPRQRTVHAGVHDNDSGMEPSKRQAWIEKHIYRKVVEDTPPSVLRHCNLSTKISVPYWNYEGSFGIGSMVRQQIGESILNMYGSTSGCIDFLQVDFRNIAGQKNTASPFTFDVLDTLFDMQREGLIRSINGVEFPVPVLNELKGNDFYFDTNQVTCNLLDPNDYSRELRNFCEESKRDGRPLKVVMKSPLAGGLLSNKYSQIPNRYRDRFGEPMSQYMLPSEKNHYNTSLKMSWRKYYNQREGDCITSDRSWIRFEQTVLEMLAEISLKHQTDLASVAIRYLLQQEHVGSISVGSSLNAISSNEKTFTRPRDSRKVFAFHLDAEDMENLARISGEMESQNVDDLGQNFDHIDFSNPKLWL